MDKLKPYKVPIILVIVLVVLFTVAKIVLPLVNQAPTSEKPIVKIEASCDKVYNSIADINVSDFTITAIHKDSIETSLDSENVTLSTASSKPVGAETEVELTLIEDKSVTCKCTVKIKREKILGFQCGYPVVTDVIAVLYSNGELCFEGTGDTLVFYEGEYPWLDDYNYRELQECPITSVSFESSVTPSNMNFWFEGLTTLTYVDPIPQSVRTMVRTFKGCTNLRVMADWSKAESLLNINEAYAGCTALISTSPIPSRVRIAKSAFSGCIELQASPEVDNAVSLVNTTNMFKECGKLIQTVIPPNVTDISGMYSDCINLKVMPEIPTSVVIMKSCFEGDLNLVHLSSLPQSIDDTSSAFSGCEMITGEMTVNCNPHDSSGMFTGAAVATKVNLTGSSLLLDVLANTSDSGNIYINKAKPNPALTRYDDVIKED